MAERREFETVMAQVAEYRRLQEEQPWQPQDDVTQVLQRTGEYRCLLEAADALENRAVNAQVTGRGGAEVEREAQRLADEFRAFRERWPRPGSRPGGPQSTRATRLLERRGV